jgi:putative component of toxin-antitoxin plasmid stabilization module
VLNLCQAAGPPPERGSPGSPDLFGSSPYRIDFGPGYRIYFGKDGATCVILVGGSTKKRQSAAISAAADAWTDYKRRKPAR